VTLVYYLKGLEYDLNMPVQQDGPTAKFHGRFNIQSKSLKNSTSIIMAQTANGEFVELTTQKH